MKKCKISLSLIAFLLLQINLIYGQGIDKPRYQVITHRAGVYLGTFNIELFPLIAPLATANFDSLVNVQFYDSTAFHRVVPGFVIQGGDPNSINGPISTWGQGNPNQPNVNAEFSVARHYRGRLGAARDVDTNSANSQFYICVANAFSLDGNYTVYGQVTSGMDIVDTIVNSPRNGNDVPLQKIEMFITNIGVNDTVPNQPMMLTPLDHAHGVLPTTTFSWTHIDDAVLYNMEVSTDSLFSNIVFVKNVATESLKIQTLNSYTKYFWRVKANNGGHESGYSAVFSFTTGIAPAQLILPPNAVTGNILNPVCVWNTVPYATTYELQVYKSLVFSPSNLVYSQTGIVDTSQQLSVLNPNTTYYWRVRGVETNDPGYYSTTFSFKTGTSVAVDEIKPGDKILTINSVYPNPANDKLNIKITLFKQGTVVLSLKNMAGVTVYCSSEKVNQLTYKPSINVSKLSKGIYMLGVSMNNHEEKIKVEVN